MIRNDATNSPASARISCVRIGNKTPASHPSQEAGSKSLSFSRSMPVPSLRHRAAQKSKLHASREAPTTTSSTLLGLQSQATARLDEKNKLASFLVCEFPWQVIPVPMGHGESVRHWAEIEKPDEDKGNHPEKVILCIFVCGRPHEELGIRERGKEMVKEQDTVHHRQRDVRKHNRKQSDLTQIRFKSIFLEALFADVPDKQESHSPPDCGIS